MQSIDGTLDLITNKMKVRAATTDTITVGTYQELTFEIAWSSICWFVTPAMLSTYPELQASVFGPTVTTPAPAMVNNPYPGSSCGLYTYQITWPPEDRARRFLTWTNGAVSVTSTDVLDAGTYGFGVTIQLVSYPTSIVTTGFKVIIDGCIIGSITPPTSTITEIIHVVGTLQSSRSFSSFTQSPDCEQQLTYSVLDSDG